MSLLAGISVVAPVDVYEPDNTMATAKVITNGMTQTRNIHLAGNEDWATVVIPQEIFNEVVHGAVSVRIETGGAGNGDTQLWLYGPDGTTQLADNDDAPGTRWSAITLPGLSPGRYYVKVREYLNDGTIGSYTLRASWLLYHL